VGNIDKLAAVMAVLMIAAVVVGLVVAVLPVGRRRCPHGPAGGRPDRAVPAGRPAAPASLPRQERPG
jgi:hypothetical protein